MEIVDETDDDEPVEFRFEPAGPGFSVWAGDRQIVAVAGRADRRAFAVNALPGRCSRAVADAVIANLERVAADEAVFDSPNPVVRDQARRRGWAGPLRRPLTRGSNTAVGSPAQPATGSVDREGLAAAVGELIGRTVQAGAPAAGSRRWFDFTRLGYSRAVRLTVESPGLSVAFPDRADVMVEAVAGALDTVLGVRERFAGHADHLRVVVFDRASHTSQPSRWIGKANDSVFSIHLDDTLALADGWVRVGGRGDGSWARHPFTMADAVTAHEAWHQIEFKFRGRRADHAAFRRQLGVPLGVDTLEQAIQGGHPRASEEFRHAHDRLRDTVSAYATTNPMEATAEMFELWWCGVTNPTIDCFGQLMQSFFGATRT